MIYPDKYTSFADWAASLLIDFNTQNTIPLERDEKKWREWGNIVATSPTFVKAGAPMTQGFASWRDWAKIVYSNIG